MKVSPFVARARRFRRQMTLPEVQLWKCLRLRPGGFKFRRQHAVGPYVLDFYCDAARLAVEVDGYSHETGSRPARDLRRDEWLLGEGILTVRLTAKDVLRNTGAAAEYVAQQCAKRTLPVIPPGPE